MRFELHKKQSDAFLSDATEILYGGAAGGGKSHLLRIASIAYCFQIPNIQVYIFRRTYPELMKNHLQGSTGYYSLLSDWIQSKECKISLGSTPAITFFNGSKIHLSYCQHEKDVYKFQGPEINVLLIDEITHFTKTIYSYLRSRVRMPEELKETIPENIRESFPRILCSGNPGGIGHNWVKMDFIDKCLPMEKIKMDKKDGGLVRQYIPSKLEDNPSLDTEEYEARLEGLGNPALVKAMRDGDWNIVSGGMFDDVWSEEHHVIKPFKIPKTWRIDRSFDWGSSKPFAVCWYAESDGNEVIENGKNIFYPKNSVIKIYEYYGWNGNPNEGCKLSSDEVAKKIKSIDKEIEKKYNIRVEAGPADNSIWNDDKKSTHDESIAKIMEKEGVKWEKSNKSPGSRINGAEIMRKMLIEAKKDIPEGPCFVMFENCKQTRRTLPTLTRDEKKTDDVDTNCEDHIYDADRYRLFKKNTVKTNTVISF